MEPYKAVFGHAMVTHTYNLLRMLGDVEKGDTQVIPTEIRLKLLRDKII